MDKSLCLEISEFQFPTNGKAYPKERRRHLMIRNWLAFVSIPYERESLSKVKWRKINENDTHRFNSLRTGKPIQRLIGFADAQITVGFNSLRTGKPIQRLRQRPRICEDTIQFQFPTNGKAYPKRPHFAPSWAVAPDTPKPNANCARLFLRKNSSLKSHKPL